MISTDGNVSLLYNKEVVLIIDSVPHQFYSHISEMDKRENNDRYGAKNPNDSGYSDDGKTSCFSRLTKHHPR